MSFTELDPGLLRNLVSIKRTTTTGTEFNATTTTTTLGPYWAQVTPAGATEVDNAKQRKGIVSYQVIIRNFGPLYPTDQILWTAYDNGTATTHTLNVKGFTRVEGFNAYYLIDATEWTQSSAS